MLDENRFGNAFDKRIYVHTHVCVCECEYMIFSHFVSRNSCLLFVVVARRLSTAAEQQFTFAIQTTFKLNSFFVFLILCTWHGYKIVTHMHIQNRRKIRNRK